MYSAAKFKWENYFSIINSVLAAPHRTEAKSPNFVGQIQANSPYSGQFCLSVRRWYVCSSTTNSHVYSKSPVQDRKSSTALTINNKSEISFFLESATGKYCGDAMQESGGGVEIPA